MIEFDRDECFVTNYEDRFTYGFHFLEKCSINATSFPRSKKLLFELYIIKKNVFHVNFTSIILVNDQRNHGQNLLS